MRERSLHRRIRGRSIQQPACDHLGGGIRELYQLDFSDGLARGIARGRHHEIGQRSPLKVGGALQQTVQLGTDACFEPGLLFY